MSGPEQIISDEEIIRVHAYANFGSMTPRDVVNDGVRKYAVGFTGGSTQVAILREHGLITKPNGAGYRANLTEKGKRYARAIYSTRTPDPAQILADAPVLDWVSIAKFAGENGVRYRTNNALIKFLNEIRIISIAPQTDPAQIRADAIREEFQFPDDVIELAKRIGRAEWGATEPKPAEDHGADMVHTVKKTAAHFGQIDQQAMHGLYIDGTGIVICHTGVSPNSPEIARVLTGLWNMLCDAAMIDAPLSPTAVDNSPALILSARRACDG